MNRLGEEKITTVPKPSKQANSNRYESDSSSLRTRIFDFLDKNPLLTAKPLCKLLGLPYKKYRSYIANLRSKWKYHHKNGLGLKCLSHRVRGWFFVPTFVDRVRAVEVGWRLSRAKNRMLFWKSGLGRLEWFETGRANFIVRSPASLGRVKQLVCNAFAWTDLIQDNTVLAKVLDTIRFKGAHDVYPTSQRLPQMRITKYKESNGIVIKLGDRTHPHAVEVEFAYPDYAERNERVMAELVELMRASFDNGLNQKRKDVAYVC